MEQRIDNYDEDDHDYSQETRWTLRVNNGDLPVRVHLNGGDYPIRYLYYKNQRYFIDSGRTLSPTTLKDLHNILALPSLIGFKEEE